MIKSLLAVLGTVCAYMNCLRFDQAQLFGMKKRRKPNLLTSVFCRSDKLAGNSHA